MSSVRYLALARIGEGGVIIPTVYTYGESCGIYDCARWCSNPSADLVTPEGLHVYESELWYILADNPDIVFVTMITCTSAYVIYDTGVNGILHIDSNLMENCDRINNMPKLSKVGYARTCPEKLAPCIRPYYLYADTQKKLLYPGNYTASYEEELDILSTPPISMYKQLTVEDADWIVSSNGETLLYKKGGV